MFGLSAAKIALLVAVVAAIVFGARVIRALGRPDPHRNPEPGQSSSPNADAADAGAATLERCARCGAYADPADHRCEP